MNLGRFGCFLLTLVVTDSDCFSFPDSGGLFSTDSYTILYPLIFAFSILGSYSIKKSMFDVGTCLAFGLVGWMFKKYRYPSSPVVLGLVLGKLIETNYIQTLMVTGPIGFVQRPMTVVLFVISFVAILYPIISDVRKARQK